MTDIAPQHVTLDQLFHGRLFRIPQYQRTYSWTERECRQLWDDILRTGDDDQIAAHFVGSIVYVILKTFAIDILVTLGAGGERFQLLIGLGFLLIVFWSPDGILGLWEKLRESRARDPLRVRGGDSP